MMVMIIIGIVFGASALTSALFRKAIFGSNTKWSELVKIWIVLFTASMMFGLFLNLMNAVINK